MALSQTDIDNLERALVSGELRVEVEGRAVTYRSIDELRRALAYVREQIASGTAAGVATTSDASFSRE